MNRLIELGKYPIRLVAQLIILCGALSVSAEQFTYSYGGHTFYFESIDDSTCKLISPQDKSECSGDLEIPSTATSSTTTYDVVEIAKSAFLRCTNLTSVTIPASVITLGDQAFLGCTDLTSVTIPNSVTKLGEWTFWDCPNVISIQYLAENPVEGSSHMFNHEIGYRATLYLHPSAIDRARELYPWRFFIYTEPIDDSGVVRDFEYTYEGLTSYYHVNDDDAKTCTLVMGKRSRDDSSNENVILPENPRNGDKEYTLTEIRTFAFSECSGIASVIIPEAVTTIGSYAFGGCIDLTSVTIPNSVTTIGSSAFCYCTSLSSVSIPNSVTTMGANVFAECSSLASVTLPNSLTKIERNTFRDCRSLASIDIPNSVMTIDTLAFGYCTNLSSVVIPNSVTTINLQAFNGCSALTSVDIPNSVTTMGTHVFWNCRSLASVTVPNSLTTIEYATFADCQSLVSVDIPNSVIDIGAIAFFGCTELISVDIPNSVATIGERAFGSCDNLTSVSIPNSVTTIGERAFSGCSNLKSVTYNTVNPLEFTRGIFANNVYSDATLYVPPTGIASTSKVDPWKRFKKVKYINTESDIEDIWVSDDNESAEIYTLTGVRIENPTNNLSPGIYIERRQGNTRKIRVM